MRAVKHCNRLPREAVDAPSLETFKALLYSRILYLLPHQQCRGTGNGGCGQFITRCLCCSFLLTLFPCSSMRSLPWETVLHERLQCESFPWAIVLHELLRFNCCCAATFSLLKYVITEALPLSLTGLALASGRWVDIKNSKKIQETVTGFGPDNPKASPCKCIYTVCRSNTQLLLHADW
ncbi:hypothetical protein QYF61_023853 [Mycteria americana]|uniref:Uncharacterized protein n=1 Tax=Mycteria americana TaxID=33587 RepID=A0AAN7Q877_MYCAM|nr:hypothetical protein QYF61_023853 [Mycteria americana]